MNKLFLFQQIEFVIFSVTLNVGPTVKPSQIPPSQFSNQFTGL